MNVLIFALELFSVSVILYAFYLSVIESTSKRDDWLIVGVPVALFIAGFTIIYSVVSTAYGWLF